MKRAKVRGIGYFEQGGFERALGFLATRAPEAIRILLLGRGDARDGEGYEGALKNGSAEAHGLRNPGSP